MKILTLSLATALLAISAGAQKVELAVVGGGMFTSGGSATFNHTGAIEGSLAYRIFHLPIASLYAELPVAAGLQGTAAVAAPTATCVISGCSFKQSSLFVAPGAKLKIGAPLVPVAAFVTAGVGVARFKETSPASSINTTNSHAAVQIGGGLDIKIAPFIGLRGEVRDYLSNGGLSSGWQHNVLAGAGIVLRF